MATISKGYEFTENELVTNVKLHALVDDATLAGITNGDIAVGAGIVDTKLAKISTAGKVSGEALTEINDIPSGAGIVPVANLGTGTPSESTLLRGDGTWGELNTSLGAWASKTVDTVYQAATDGFVFGYASVNQSTNLAYIYGYTDSNNPPTTLIWRFEISTSGGVASSHFPIFMVVKKGEYWKATLYRMNMTVLYWIPSGS